MFPILNKAMSYCADAALGPVFFWYCRRFFNTHTALLDDTVSEVCWTLNQALKWMQYLSCIVTLPYMLGHSCSCSHSKQTQSNVYTNNTSYPQWVHYAISSLDISACPTEITTLNSTLPHTHLNVWCVAVPPARSRSPCRTLERLWEDKPVLTYSTVLVGVGGVAPPSCKPRPSSKRIF